MADEPETARTTVTVPRDFARLLKQVAAFSDETMPGALLAGDLARIGTLLSANWRLQQALDPGMCTPEMARLERAMVEAGVLGGKASTTRTTWMR